MSTGAKRSRVDAQRDAEALRRLFGEMFENWVFAGSLRRGLPAVSDVEHVIIPQLVAGAPKSLFVDDVPLLNAVFQKLDQLIATAPDLVSRHVYGTSPNGAPLHRWGSVYRGIEFRGHTHELFCATPENFGPTLAIRTGPAEFSKSLVTGLLRKGRRNKDGRVWRCEVCQWCNVPADSGKKDHLCKCEGTRLIPVEVIPCPDERQYFELCGIRWLDPAERF